MNSSWMRLGAVAVGAVLLSGCWESEQALNANGVKTDTQAYQGVGPSQFVDRGWQAGDKTSWEQKLKARTAYGQNEYTRAN